MDHYCVHRILTLPSEVLELLHLCSDWIFLFQFFIVSKCLVFIIINLLTAYASDKI